VPVRPYAAISLQSIGRQPREPLAPPGLLTLVFVLCRGITVAGCSERLEAQFIFFPESHLEATPEPIGLAYEEVEFATSSTIVSTGAVVENTDCLQCANRRPRPQNPPTPPVSKGRRWRSAPVTRATYPPFFRPGKRRFIRPSNTTSPVIPLHLTISVQPETGEAILMATRSTPAGTTTPKLRLMEKKRTNSGPLRESTCKHSIYSVETGRVLLGLKGEMS
jgi:hypothetical protein